VSIGLALTGNPVGGEGLRRIQICARSRQIDAAARIWLRQQRLNDAHFARVEPVGSGRHVKTPHPVRRIADDGLCLCVATLEASHPLPERFDVVLPQAFDIS